MTVTKQGKVSNGLLFINPSDESTGFQASTIYSDDGELVWQGPQGAMFDFRPQEFEGRQYLTYWNGPRYHGGLGWGELTFLDQSYKKVHTVTLQDESFSKKFPSCIDLHDHQVTSDGTIVVTAFKPCNLWNFDETGYMIGCYRSTDVIVPVGVKQVS